MKVVGYQLLRVLFEGEKDGASRKLETFFVLPFAGNVTNVIQSQPEI